MRLPSLLLAAALATAAALAAAQPSPASGPRAAGTPSPASPTTAPAELAAHAEAARSAMAAGRFAEAASHYAEIVKVLPDEPGMRLNLGMALSMAGRPREAVPHLQAALRRRPDIAPAALFLGAAYVELGRRAEAVAPLETFLAAQPAHREARAMLADALLALGRALRAAGQFRLLADQDARDPKAWYGLGRSYEKVAQRAFEALRTAAPESPHWLVLAGEALLADERDKAAFVLLRDAAGRRPELAAAHEGLAVAYERTGHADWAQVERERARALSVPDCRAPSLECDFRAGRLSRVLDAAQSPRTTESRYWTARAAGELARQAFAHLLQLPASAESALVRLGVLRGQRRYLESKQELDAALAAWPEDARLRRERAALHLMAREHAQARPVLEELLAREPDAPDLNLMLGEAWLETKEPAKAIPRLEKAVRADPGATRARGLLGRALLDAGRAAAAVPHLEAALRDDEDGSLHFQLARAYRETSRPAQAAAALAAFEDLRRRGAVDRETASEDVAITPP